MMSSLQPLHVLVVDDSAVVREVLSAILSQDGAITVAVAPDPFIAMAKIKQNRPDVIVLDLEMPRMDGMTFLKKIVREDPIPVVICSALAGSSTAVGLQALEEGAVEVVNKPRLGVKQFLEESAVIIVDAVRGAAASRAKSGQAVARSLSFGPSRDALHSRPAAARLAGAGETVVALGASTGGTDALATILRAMPNDAPGMIIVQHMPEGFTAAFAQRLNQSCALTVKEAVNGEPMAPGTALIAPGNRHAVLRRDGASYVVEVKDGALVSRHRPSVDVLFRAVAESAGPNAIGVLLTGMGSDGAAGLLEMKQAGAFTIAQDELSSVVFGMPKEAIERGAATKVVHLSHIAHEILSYRFHKDGGAV
jgi:two-component system, chemotaxis family, protein-glutamate methylesterase/glutaminase